MQVSKIVLALDVEEIACINWFQIIFKTFVVGMLGIIKLRWDAMQEVASNKK